MHQTHIPLDSTTSIGRRIATSRECAKYLKITERHLHNMRGRGLPCLRMGKSVRYDLVEVDAWLEGQRQSVTA